MPCESLPSRIYTSDNELLGAGVVQLLIAAQMVCQNGESNLIQTRSFLRGLYMTRLLRCALTVLQIFCGVAHRCAFDEMMCYVGLIDVDTALIKHFKFH